MNRVRNGQFEQLVRIACLAIGSAMIGCVDTDEPIEEVESAEIQMVEITEGWTVERPEPGTGVVVEVLHEDGTLELARVETDDSGRTEVEYLDHAAFELPQGTSAACVADCQDNLSSPLGYKWNKSLQWSYNDAGRPAGIAQQAAIDAFVDGATGIVNSRNGCGLADEVPATMQYAGTTNSAPGISGGSCSKSDGKNVVGWGALAGGTLAVTCTWYSGGSAVESDMLYRNGGVSWFAGTSPDAGCFNKYSLRATATHEFGHAFGLGHVNSCTQTMRPSMSPCTAADRNLGVGDVSGLRNIY